MPQLTGLSGTSTFFPDILDMCQEACERAGVDFTSGNSLRSARMSLDLMSQEWANEGLNLWTVDCQTINLAPGVPLYPLPVDTIDVIHPFIRVNGNDLNLSRVDITGYASISNKMQEGKPALVYIDRQSQPTLTVWPVPAKNSSYQLVYYRMRRMQDSGSPTNSMDIPSRFAPAMIAGLAYRMAQKSRDQVVMQRLPMLKADYDEAFNKAKYEDRTRAPFILAPRFT